MPLSTIVYHEAETLSQVVLRGHLDERGEASIIGAVLMSETIRSPKTLRRNRYAEGVEKQSADQKSAEKLAYETAKSANEEDPCFISNALRGLYGANVASEQELRIKRSATKAVLNPRYPKDEERLARVEEQRRIADVLEEVGAETVAFLLEQHNLRDIGTWTRTRYHLCEKSAFEQCRQFISLPSPLKAYLLGQARGRKKRLWASAEEVVRRFGDRPERFDSLHKAPKATVCRLSQYQDITCNSHEAIAGVLEKANTGLETLAFSGLLEQSAESNREGHLLGFVKWYARSFARKIMSMHTLGYRPAEECPDEERLTQLTNWEPLPSEQLDREEVAVFANQYLRVNNPRMSETGRRALLLMLTGEGFTYREIGSAVGMSEGAVKVLACRYAQPLREHVAKVMVG